MKLTLPQLEPHLAKQLAPIYIVSSDDLTQKREAIQLIRKAAKLAGYAERMRFQPEAGIDWEQLYACLYSRSLLSEKRLIECDFRDSAPNKTASDILKEYAAKLSPDIILLIDIGKIDDKIAKSAWYKSLEKIGMVLTIWPIPREQLPAWIMQRARKYKLQLQPAAAALLADSVEGNLAAAAQLLEKLYLLRPQQPIDTNFIQTLLTDESQFTVFDLTDSVIANNPSRTLHILDTLKSAGTEPVLVLWSITRELRLLADMAKQLQQGATYDQLFQKQRIFSRRQPAIRRFLTRFTAEDCWRHLSHAIDVDRIIKGAAPGNAWESLQLFCLRML